MNTSTLKQNRHGFTLLELCLVMSLLLILTAASIPFFLSTNSVNLDGSARKLEADIRYAQSLSTTTSDEYGFRTVLGAEGTKTAYEIYKVSDNSVVISPYHHDPMHEDFLTDFKGVIFTDDYSLRFDKLGTPTFVTGASPIQIQNSDGDTKRLNISSVGLINIQ